MATTTLQIPITKRVRDNATKAAREQGFSSLQEVVRVFLSKFADRCIDVSFTPPAVQLSEKNAKRYDRMVQDVLDRKVKTKIFANVDDLMAELNS